MPRLEQWGVVPLLAGPYTPPEQAGLVLRGFVYGYPNGRFPDGEGITTNLIMHAGEEPNTVVTKSGSVYTLGEVDPVYENMYPNARERFFNTLPKK